MFQSFQFRDLHEAIYRLIVENLAIRREHWRKLEREHFLIPPTNCAIDSNLLVGRHTSEARALKDDGRTAVRNDLIHLLAVERNDIAFDPFDISAGYEGVTRTQDFARPTEY